MATASKDADKQRTPDAFEPYLPGTPTFLLEPGRVRSLLSRLLGRN